MNAKNKKRDNRTIKITVTALIFLAIGFIMLNYVSAMEKPPLGTVFNIIVGCVFIALSAIVLFVMLKTHFFPKKKRQSSKPIFLDKELLKKQND